MDVQAGSPRSEILKVLKPGQNLLAVSKLQNIEKIKKLHSEGQIHFGENYVQEALDKIEALQNLNLQWHLIGPIQKNKVKYLKKNFAYIHSVDSIELAELISKKALEVQHQQKVFIQVNISNEESKSGFAEENLLAQWDKLKALTGLNILGLMAMPPLENSAENNRPFFKKLKSLATQLGLYELSMGTSQDYQVALEEGATWIRVGTVLFGERSKKSDSSQETRTP